MMFMPSKARMRELALLFGEIPASFFIFGALVLLRITFMAKGE
jgi:hypothetical protein